MYKFKVNSKGFESSKSKITGSEILEMAGLIPQADYELLFEVNEKGFTPIQLDEVVDLKTVGIEGLKATPYKPIIIKVDGQDVEVHKCIMTPTEILAAANINTNRFSLREMRKGEIEVTYKDDVEHKIALTKKSRFFTCEIEIKIDCVIVNSKPKEWSQDEITFDDIVILAYGEISKNPNVIYTINYIKGVPNKPEGSMIKGDIVSVNNKMIFNVTRTDKS